MNPEAKLAELGLTLPNPPAAAGSYVPTVRTGNLLYCAGTICMVDGKMTHTGQVGKEQTVATAWDAWATQQHFSGAAAVADHANPELMNRYTWYRAHHWRTPYPGDSTILAPSAVPGAYVPNADTE